MKNATEKEMFLVTLYKEAILGFKKEDFIFDKKTISNECSFGVVNAQITQNLYYNLEAVSKVSNQLENYIFNESNLINISGKKYFIPNTFEKKNDAINFSLNSLAGFNSFKKSKTDVILLMKAVVKVIDDPIFNKSEKEIIEKYYPAIKYNIFIIISCEDKHSSDLLQFYYLQEQDDGDLITSDLVSLVMKILFVIFQKDYRRLSIPFYSVWDIANENMNIKSYEHKKIKKKIFKSVEKLLEKNNKLSFYFSTFGSFNANIPFTSELVKTYFIATCSKELLKPKNKFKKYFSDVNFIFKK